MGERVLFGGVEGGARSKGTKGGVGKSVKKTSSILK